MKKERDIFCVSLGHVYTLEKYGHIKNIDISCTGRGGPQTKRYSLQSVKNFIEKRKVDPESNEIHDEVDRGDQQSAKTVSME
ncbi:MAG: hypothetical protein JW786_00120 [Desulfobacterales bacterium]|nr:hypothetical protein [Desulfobacterales bacterium]